MAYLLPIWQYYFPVKEKFRLPELARQETQEGSGWGSGAWVGSRMKAEAEVKIEASNPGQKVQDNRIKPKNAQCLSWTAGIKQ